MKAIGFYENLPIEHEDSLMALTIDTPEPKDRELLVEIKAIAVNPADYFGRRNVPVEQGPNIVGWDASGTVVAVGEEASLFNVGDEVFYSGDATKAGANSEFHIVDERIVGIKPKRISYGEAAAVPLTGLAAYEGIFDRLKISRNIEENKGKSMLIIGAAGGVGSMAIQLAKSVGLTVIGTASREESIKWAKELGADYTINHYEQFMPQLKEQNLSEVNYILCSNSTDKHWENMAEAIKPQGAICGIAALENQIDLSLLGFKSASFAWEMMFTRSMFQTEDMIEQHHALNKMSAMIDAGQIKTTINTVMTPINVENLKKAHAMMESGKTIGKIVLETFEK